MNEANITRLIEHVFGGSAPDAVLPIDAPRLVMIALTSLTDREESIIRWRYGLDRERLTLDAIAPLLPNLRTGQDGVTRERVRQMEAKALRKLRHPGNTGTTLKLIAQEIGLC